jgi:AcrR family transcriptional regulator
VSQTTTKPLRADARRNRERLMQAAGELFAEQGTDVSLEAVAARAGVGIGTLYRNFPNRDALVEAAYRSEVTSLCEAARDLLAEHEPDEALARWMERFVTYTEAKRGMKAALQSVAGRSDLYSDTSAQITAAIETLLRAGVEAGRLRADVGAGDVRNAMNAIWALGDRDEARAQAQTLIRIIVDGLRHGAGGAPPA